MVDQIELHMFAPMKTLSVPKLVLQAALLVSRLRIEFEKSLTFCIEKSFMWTDSTSVLQWLNSTSQLPVFVANCVSEIIETTTIDEWLHLFSGDNAVDTNTRRITAEALKESGWVEGPVFVKTSDWPFKPDIEVLTSIRLKGSSYDLNKSLNKLQNSLAHLKPLVHFLSGKIFSKIPKNRHI